MTHRQEEFAKELGNCAGKWVATTDDDRVVGCGDTVQEAVEQAHANDVKDPVVFPVPAQDGCFFF